MKRTMLTTLLLTLAGATWAAAPTIENVTALTPAENGSEAFVFSYTLKNEPAVVTVDIQKKDGTTWQSLGGEKTGFLNGEANKVVRTLDAPSKVYWFPHDGTVDMTTAAEYRAVVKAWSTNCPPNYMIVPLDVDNSVVSRVRWYATTNDFPGGFSDIQYKTTSLVLRKVPCAGITWLRGSPRTLETPGNDTTNNPAHYVKFTQDYYMAIYETTQKQQYLMGDTWTGFSDPRDDNPAGRTGYGKIRGYTSGVYHIISEPKPTSVIGVLRARSGIADFDLPTAALFECAARAGSSTYLPNDEAWTQANFNKYVVSSANKKSGVSNGGYQPVGSKLPNAWGFYDMQGNMHERLKELMGTGAYLDSFHDSLVSDWATGGVTIDPQSPVNNSGRAALASGSWNEGFNAEPTKCVHALGIMADGSPGWTEHSTTYADYIGYRVCCSVAAAVK